MSKHSRLLWAFGIFAVGIGFGTLLHQPESEKESNAPSVRREALTAGHIGLRDALAAAEAFLLAAGHIEGRSIGAMWRAHENERDWVYFDIWPPYQGEHPPAGNTLRLAIRVNDRGVADWTWVEGTVLVDRDPQLNRALVLPDVTSVGADGRRRVVLPPEDGSFSLRRVRSVAPAEQK